MSLFLPPWSRNLRRHGDSQIVVQIAMLALSMLFWGAAKLQTGPVMAAEVYGVWITTYPAEWWAGSIMAGSTLYVVGIVVNGAWRWSPVFRVLGAAWHVITLSAFVVGAWGATFGDFFVLVSFVWAVMHGVFLAWNIADLAQSCRGRD